MTSHSKELADQGATSAEVDEKRPWVAPAATVEKVEQATGITPSGSVDGAACHS